MGRTAAVRRRKSSRLMVASCHGRRGPRLVSSHDSSAATAHQSWGRSGGRSASQALATRLGAWHSQASTMTSASSSRVSLSRSARRTRIAGQPLKCGVVNHAPDRVGEQCLLHALVGDAEHHHVVEALARVGVDGVRRAGRAGRRRACRGRGTPAGRQGSVRSSSPGQRRRRSPRCRRGSALDVSCLRTGGLLVTWSEPARSSTSSSMLERTAVRRLH